MSSPTDKTPLVLDYTAFPHIVDAILAYAFESPKTCATLRRVCRSFRRRVDTRPLPHVYVHLDTNTDAVVVTAPLGCAEGPLPLGVRCDLDAKLSKAKRAARQRRFAKTRVVDLGPPGIGVVRREWADDLDARMEHCRFGFPRYKEPRYKYLEDLTAQAHVVRFLHHEGWAGWATLSFEALLAHAVPRAFDIRGSEHATRIDIVWLPWSHYNHNADTPVRTMLYMPRTMLVCRERIINVHYDPRNQRTRFMDCRFWLNLHIYNGTPLRSITVIFTPVLHPHAPPDYSHLEFKRRIEIDKARVPAGVLSQFARHIASFITAGVDITCTFVGIDEMNPLHLNLFDDGDSDEDDATFKQRVFHSKIDKTREEKEAHIWSAIEEKLQGRRALRDPFLTFLSRHEYADHVGPEMFALATDEKAVVYGECPL